jgi:ribosomal protein S18 acetylase RimI-like enzyme
MRVGATISVDNECDPVREHIARKLDDFNKEPLGEANYKPLTTTARDNGRIVGGLVGATFHGWFYIEALWIDDAWRNRGLGRSLLQTAEAEARQRGVRNAYVDTFSFQAPGFYKKLGYEEFGKLDDFPKGHTRYWMTKAL